MSALRVLGYCRLRLVTVTAIVRESASIIFSSSWDGGLIMSQGGKLGWNFQQQWIHDKRHTVFLGAM